MRNVRDTFCPPPKMWRSGSYPVVLWTVLVAALTQVTKASIPDNPPLNTVFAQALNDVSISDLVKGPPLTSAQGLNASCFNDSDGYSRLKTCLASQCASREDLARLYSTTTSGRLQAPDLVNAAPGLVYVLTQRFLQPQCQLAPHPTTPPPRRSPPSAAAVWGYGFACVTVINMCSLSGIVLSACAKLKAFKVILMFMVALAVGTLLGSGLLVLIPEALELTHGGDHFLWKVCAVVGGIYLFFLVERVMRMINAYREKTTEQRDQDEEATHDTVTASFQMHPVHNPHLDDPLPDSAHLSSNPHGPHLHNGMVVGNVNRGFVSDEGRSQSPTPKSSELPKSKNGLKNTKALDPPEKPQQKSQAAAHGHSHGGSGQVAPVAYMIVFGDAMHNFIDGLSIGAAFSATTLLGVSVSLAVFCEELPHELGDFAILLNAGLSMRRALFYNFLSSLSCYVGLVIGIVLGENTQANTWIFALAGGMFLYISLTDMLPEMNSAAETEEGQEFGHFKTFLLQNIGLILGYGIILILAVYGDEISIPEE